MKCVTDGDIVWLEIVAVEICGRVSIFRIGLCERRHSLRVPYNHDLARKFS